MSALASVILPTYNRASVLPGALDSVLAQRYRPLELVVVDDGSTDDTAAVIAGWQREHAAPGLEVRYIAQPNAGPAAARNRGIASASGDYLYFLDSDDRMHPDLLEAGVKALEAAQADCVLFGFDTLAASGRTGAYLPPDQAPLLSLVDHDLWGFTSSSLKRASLVQEAGPWLEDCHIGEDYEFLARCLLIAKETTVLRQPLLTVTMRESRLSDGKNSAAGVASRVRAERAVAGQLTAARSRLGDALLYRYTGRLLRSAVNLCVSGHVDAANVLLEIVEQLGHDAGDWRARLRRQALTRGRWACVLLLRGAGVGRAASRIFSS